ncbi:hypothetical protein NW754_003761 [Fusarium falciforme]|nr:hypothetical protein NW754_003761 [Fusarium falciforme]
MAVAERPPTDFTDEYWSKLPEENKPGVATLDQEEMKKRIKELRRWKKFEETGEALTGTLMTRRKKNSHRAQVKKVGVRATRGKR